MERAAAEAAAAQESMEYDPATGEANTVHTAGTTNSANKANAVAKTSKARPRPRPKARDANDVEDTTDDARARAAQADAAADAMAFIMEALNDDSTSTSTDTHGRPHRRKTQTPAGEALATQNTAKALKALKAADTKAKRLAQAQGGETTAAKKTKKVSVRKPRSKR